MEDPPANSSPLQATSVFENIRTELILSVDAVSDQMSPEFAAQLKGRVEHLHEKIGYPDWVLEQDKVNTFYTKMVSRGQFVGNT